MPSPSMQEVLLRELRAHRVSVDRLAAYLLVIAKSSAPCPRCYARGAVTALVIAAAVEGTERGTCAACDASFFWAA
ncbi:MAG: hypothetical protein ACREUX_13840 [Burkholderiales bacterium]